MQKNLSNQTSKQDNLKYDAVIVGAGFSGLYMLHRLREAGLSVCVFEAGDGVGGVWYWNRYPGARCDTDSIYYNYTFSEELYHEWTWSKRYASQPEILRYLNYVADKFDLRSDIQFKKRVTAAEYDEASHLWRLKVDGHTEVSTKYFITAVGCLSSSNVPDFKGLNTFEGEWYHTGNWPKTPVSFKGKNVGVIGTGSSGVQSIPEIEKEAEHLTVFQRTPQYSVPAKNHLYSPEFSQEVKESYHELRRHMHDSNDGLPINSPNRSALDDSAEEREQVYEDAWQRGGVLHLSATYNDLTTNPEANETVSEFIREKIKERVNDAEMAKKLEPTYYFGTKRPITDTNYFEIFNKKHVSLVDVKNAPIQEIKPWGIKTTKAEYELDVLVFATGYDAITGSLFKMDIRGKNGLTLKEKWKDGAQAKTNLGITTAGFPNMFIITGPESPSVITNMPIAIEQHVDWITNCIQYLESNHIQAIEAKTEAENAWSTHCNEVAQETLYVETSSWYTGANISDKPEGLFPIYLGSISYYRDVLDQEAANDYGSFQLINRNESINN